MTAKQLKEVVDAHSNYLDIDSRVTMLEMIVFVEDLLEKEIAYLKNIEPHATVSIGDTRKAVEIIQDLYHAIDNMDSNDLVDAGIWE